jgi:hypothetical protein
MLFFELEFNPRVSATTFFFTVSFSTLFSLLVEIWAWPVSLLDFARFLFLKLIELHIRSWALSSAGLVFLFDSIAIYLSKETMLRAIFLATSDFRDSFLFNKMVLDSGLEPF